MNKILPSIAMVLTFMACGLALWDNNIALAAANINAVVWIGLHLLNN